MVKHVARKFAIVVPPVSFVRQRRAEVEVKVLRLPLVVEQLDRPALGGRVHAHARHVRAHACRHLPVLVRHAPHARVESDGPHAHAALHLRPGVRARTHTGIVRCPVVRSNTLMHGKSSAAPLAAPSLHSKVCKAPLLQGCFELWNSSF
eukprot:1122046-Pleurochrysis_carterae.AAC.4